MTYILNEDAAIKAKLQGLRVHDTNAPAGGRPVTVLFRMPEQELRDRSYPFIAITRSDIQTASDREHRGKAPLLYVPEQASDTWDPAVESPETTPYVVNYPIPVDVLYQITVRTRKQSHHSEIVAALSAPDRLHPRFGFVEIPQDGTVRTLTIEGGPEFQWWAEDGDKRVFSADYVVRMPSELLPSVITEATRVEQVVVNELEVLDSTNHGTL